MNKYVIVILLLSFNLLFSQNLKGVDFIVSNYPQFNSIDEVSNRIEKDFYLEKEKVRAVYTWMANNIRYGEFILQTPKVFLYTSQKDLEEQIEKRIEDSATRTFNSKKGICYDYAALFYKICTNLDIKTEIIKGFAKTKVTATNSTKITSIINNHAWNKVFIDDKPYLIDTTWSVNILPNINGYIKDINYDYFLTNPNLFILNHYPENFEDSLIKDDLSALTFINYPIIYMRSYKNVRLIRPIKSKINRNIKTNTKFTFRVIKPVNEVSFYLGNKFYDNIPYNYENSILTFDLDLEDNNDNNLTVFINNKAICSYWVE